MTTTITPDWISVLDRTPILLPNGDVDVTAALQHILDEEVPLSGQFMPHSDRRQNSSGIVFPSLDGVRSYVLTRTIAMPGNKNIALAGSAPSGARIRFEPDPVLRPDPPAFTSHRGARTHSFENLILDGGGVDIDGPTSGPTVFRSCILTRIPGYAITTRSPGVVRVLISHSSFVETDRGVGVLHKACDNWLIADNTTFVRLAGVGVDIRSSGVTLRDVRFESRQPLEPGGHDRDEPYVRIRDWHPPDSTKEKAFSGGLVEITSCRFGGEVGHDLRVPYRPDLPGPPRFAIEIGPNEASRTITALRITGSWFLGRRHHDGPTPTSAVGAIQCHQHLTDSVLMANYFQRYLGPLIVEDLPASTQDASRPNMFLANTVPPNATRGGIFSRGGVNWHVLPALPDPH